MRTVQRIHAYETQPGDRVRFSHTFANQDRDHESFVGTVRRYDKTTRQIVFESGARRGGNTEEKWVLLKRHHPIPKHGSLWVYKDEGSQWIYNDLEASYVCFFTSCNFDVGATMSRPFPSFESELEPLLPPGE